MLKASDLKPQSISVDFTMNYERIVDPITGKASINGRKFTAVLQLLTKHQWEEIGLTVEDPIPDKKMDGTNDYDGMAYRTRVARANYKRNVRRLCFALEKGGAFDFEGADDFDKQEAVLRDVDTGVFNALFTELQNAANMFEVRVSATAAAFPSANGKRGIPESAVTDNVAASELVPDLG